MLNELYGHKRYVVVTNQDHAGALALYQQQSLKKDPNTATTMEK